MLKYPPELLDKFVVSRELGVGAFGPVRLGFHVDSKTPVAIKIVRKTTKSIPNLVVNNDVDHPSLVRVLDVVETDSHLFIVREFAAGGKLFDEVRVRLG